ncbi:MAG TPA: chloride channel protein [Candidatus Limnocylindrales bacterium]|nr:chloride channel protein [Candidatus Limnocylindrales bacterium]
MRLLPGLRARIRSAEYLHKWIVLGALIGVISGIGAALFLAGLELATRVFLGGLAAYTPASALGEGGNPISDPQRPLLIPFVVALGGLISGVIVFRLAPEAEGHGTDAAIAAFHHGARRIRARIPAIKLLASAITIGAGGSGGREGPTAQIGAGFGSWLARILDLDARDARIAVACGMGAGIGAIFRAPLGGAVLAAEIPYRDDVESEALVPGFVASIVAFSVFGALVGYSPIFGRVAGAGFTDARQLVYYALLGIAAGVVGRLYIRAFYGTSRRFAGWKLPHEVRPAIAGFVVGCIALVVPGVLGTGYGWVQAALDRTTLLGLPLWMVLILPLAKIVATSLSIGSGGSGGIFGPGMVIGGLLGASAWRLLEPVAPAMPADPSGFVIVAMMALFGSVAHAPLAVMLMVAEMTDSLAMLAPAMLAIGVATLIVGDRTIYRSQLKSRAESPAHQFRFALPLMASVSASHAARVPRLLLSVNDRIGTARSRLEAADLPGAPVVDQRRSLKGSVLLAELIDQDPARTLAELPLSGPVVTVDDGLDDALAILSEAHRSWAPVTAGDEVVGVISVGDILGAYRSALAANVRQVRSVGATEALVEAEVTTSSRLVGRAVADAGWPRDAVLVSIGRGGRLIVPRGDVVLLAGDRLTIFATQAAREALSTLLATPLPDAATG